MTNIATGNLELTRCKMSTHCHLIFLRHSPKCHKVFAAKFTDMFLDHWFVCRGANSYQEVVTKDQLMNLLSLVN